MPGYRENRTCSPHPHQHVTAANDGYGIDIGAPEAALGSLKHVSSVRNSNFRRAIVRAIDNKNFGVNFRRRDPSHRRFTDMVPSEHAEFDGVIHVALLDANLSSCGASNAVFQARSSRPTNARVAQSGGGARLVQISGDFTRPVSQDHRLDSVANIALAVRAIPSCSDTCGAHFNSSRANAFFKTLTGTSNGRAGK